MRFGHKVSEFNAEVTGAGAQRREPKAPRFWRPVDRLVKGRLPVVLYWHSRPNAHSRYFAPARPMAPGTRTPNGRTVPDKLAGWPRDLNTRLAAKTVARMGAVFSLQATTKTSPKHQTNEHRSKAFNAEGNRRRSAAEGTKSGTLLASG
jgi:hypothetical protein